MSATATPVTPADRLSFTLFVALALHATLIFGIGFAQKLTSPNSSMLEVTLAFQPSEQAPEEADFIAQANQQGSGSLDEVREMTTDEISPYDGHQLNDVNLTPPSAQEQSHASRLMITSITETSVAAPADDAQRDRPDTPLPQGKRDNFTPLSKKIATLEARLAQQKQAYAKRPRYHFVNSVSAMAGVEALYINAFRQEVEAVGTRNFPQQALEQRIFGNVRLRVDINESGRVTQVKLLHSSGHDLLDHAAMHSVKLAAPFAPFTEKMRNYYASKGFDQIAIVRTWQFNESSTLTSSYD